MPAKTLWVLGEGDLLSSVAPQSPVEGGEDAHNDKSLSSVTGKQLYSYKGWEKRLELGRVTEAEDVWAVSCRGSSRLLGPAAVRRVKVCAGSC